MRKIIKTKSVIPQAGNTICKMVEPLNNTFLYLYRDTILSFKIREIHFRPVNWSVLRFLNKRTKSIYNTQILRIRVISSHQY